MSSCFILPWSLALDLHSEKEEVTLPGKFRETEWTTCLGKGFLDDTTGESLKIKTLSGPFWIPCHFLKSYQFIPYFFLENLVFFLNVSSFQRFNKNLELFLRTASGSTLCLLLMTDGANSVQPNDMAEAVAAHQVRGRNLRNQLTERIWSNYSDLTRPHPKWWFSKGMLLISGKSRLVKYYNLARRMVTPLHPWNVCIPLVLQIPY